MRQEWTALTDSLHLREAVEFHGALPLSEVAMRMAECHVFCLPSVRESGGAVLLEAMACARPVIALDFGGPGEIVTPETGVLLPLTSPEQVSADLAATLNDIFIHPAIWQTRGMAGRAEVENRYSWPAKIASAQETYRELIIERNLSCC